MQTFTQFFDFTIIWCRCLTSLLFTNLLLELRDFLRWHIREEHKQHINCLLSRLRCHDELTASGKCRHICNTAIRLNSDTVTQFTMHLFQVYVMIKYYIVTCYTFYYSFYFECKKNNAIKAILVTCENAHQAHCEIPNLGLIRKVKRILFIQVNVVLQRSTN